MDVLAPRTNKRGRKSLPWEEKADKTKQEEILAFSRELKIMPKEKVLRAVVKMLNETGDKDLAAVIKAAIKNPELTKTIRKKMKTEECTVTQLPKLEALGLVLDCKLTKYQYKLLREKINACGQKILPCYDHVTEAKNECRPPAESVTISETAAFVKLQDLLTHTLRRIVTLSYEFISENQNRSGTTHEVLKLKCSYGFDGSTGQSSYKQGYANSSSASSNDDASLFVTTMIQLVLENKNGIEYWRNTTPQSTRFCRPVRILFAKETKALIESERAVLSSEVSNLKNVSIVLQNGHMIEVVFELYLTIIDSKVLSVLNGVASSMCCPICGAKPNDFNNLDNINKGVFQPKQGALLHGVSPLHCWIRFFEFLLHLAYRIPFKSWQIKSEFKLVAAEQKKLIQARFWKEMGLRVDYPAPGGSGTSNDGNTARRAFSNYKLLSSILTIDEKLIVDLRTILIAFGSQLPIDHDKFQKHCHQLIYHYMSLYSWFKLPASVHKILIHGADVIRTCSLPMGMLSEEGSECRNKMYREDRERHARKMNRCVTMHDVFYRAMDSSDPVISSGTLAARKSLRKREPLPAAVIDMLLPTRNAITCQDLGDFEIHLDPEFVELLNDLSFVNQNDDE